MAVVIDASVALGWVLPSQASPLTRAALTFVENESGVVPPHFAIEVVRVLRSRERRGLISPDTVDAAVVLVQRQSLTQDQMDAIDCSEAIVALARRYTLRAADAAYLELAMRMKLPLATRDAAFAAAATKAGAALFGH
jgi:predicted nucleic acid-binding protein